MSRSIRFDEEADTEFTAAIRRLEQQRAGFGAKLFDAVQDALALVREHPEAGSSAGLPESLELRFVLVRRFHYRIVYHIRRSEIVVVAVAHTSRRPGYWKNRLTTDKSP